MLINIAIEKKHPIVDGTPVIVCGNNGYQIKFSFDEEWSNSQLKTARFAWRKEGKALYIDVPFTGDTVDVPLLTEVRYVLVGVYTDHLRTTTPARIACEYSIRCNSGEDIQEPTPEDVLIDLFNLVTAQQDAAIRAADEATASAAIAAENRDISEEAAAAATRAATDAESTVGLADKLRDSNNKIPMHLWIGSREEYEAEKDALPTETLVLLTDDSSILTKDITDEVLLMPMAVTAEVYEKVSGFYVSKNKFAYSPLLGIVFFNLEFTFQGSLPAGASLKFKHIVDKTNSTYGYAPALPAHLGLDDYQRQVGVEYAPDGVEDYAVLSFSNASTGEIAYSGDEMFLTVSGWYFCNGK